jgi:hypothetical protein
MRRILFTICTLTAAAGALGGCATAAKDTTGFATQREIVVAKPFTETWVATKDVLVASELLVYTRDKRGTFEAFDGPTNPIPYIRNRRMKYTIDLIAESNTTTRVQLQATRQVYGSSLTTYPDWHDRKTDDAERLDEIAAAIEAKALGLEAMPAMDAEAEAPEAPAESAAPAEAPAEKPAEAATEEVVVEDI